MCIRISIRFFHQISGGICIGVCITMCNPIRLGFFIHQRIISVAIAIFAFSFIVFFVGFPDMALVANRS